MRPWVCVRVWGVRVLHANDTYMTAYSRTRPENWIKEQRGLRSFRPFGVACVNECTNPRRSVFLRGPSPRQINCHPNSREQFECQGIEMVQSGSGGGGGLSCFSCSSKNAMKIIFQLREGNIMIACHQGGGRKSCLRWRRECDLLALPFVKRRCGLNKHRRKTFWLYSSSALLFFFFFFFCFFAGGGLSSSSTSSAAPVVSSVEFAKADSSAEKGTIAKDNFSNGQKRTWPQPLFPIVFFLPPFWNPARHNSIVIWLASRERPKEQHPLTECGVAIHMFSFCIL